MPSTPSPQPATSPASDVPPSLDRRASVLAPRHSGSAWSWACCSRFAAPNSSSPAHISVRREKAGAPASSCCSRRRSCSRQRTARGARLVLIPFALFYTVVAFVGDINGHEAFGLLPIDTRDKFVHPSTRCSRS